MWTMASCFALRATWWLINVLVDKHLEAASLRLNLFKLFRNWFIFNQPLIICPRIALDTQKASTVRFHLFVIVMVTCIVGMSLSDL